MEQNTARTFCIDILILIGALAMMAAMAFGVSAWEALQREEFDASVFGLSYKYADEVPLMEIYLWCGKEDADPNAASDGTTPLGDTQGNIRAYSLRLLRDKVTVHNLDWDGYSETKNGTDAFETPVFTIKNKLGGKLRVAYEYKGLGALLYSTDDLRVPVDDWDGWLYKKLRKLEIGLPPESVHRMNVDVFTDYASVGELDEKMTLSIPFDPFSGGLPACPEEMRLSVPIETEAFQKLYPSATGLFPNVTRKKAITHLHIYAFDPDNESSVIAEAELRLVHYTPWKTEDGTFSPEQLQYMKAQNILNAAYCEVTVAEYEQEVIRQ